MQALTCASGGSARAVRARRNLPTMRPGRSTRGSTCSHVDGAPINRRRQAEIALEANADAVAHGCTGRATTPVRFELAYAAFAPHLKIIAPWREWNIPLARGPLEYASARGGLGADRYAREDYSRIATWHISHEGGPLESGQRGAGRHVHVDELAGECAGPRAVHRDGFDAGYPVTIDGEAYGAVAMIEMMNEIGGRHGVGREDSWRSLVGMKSRGVYDTPGGTLLYKAHRDRKRGTDRRTMALKDQVASRYADMVYEGRWWSTERNALDAMVDATQKAVTGTVRMKLYKGNAMIAGRQSPFSLYDEGLASFGDAGNYDHADAEGFIKLFGLPTRADARQQGKNNRKLEGDAEREDQRHQQR